jgi:hypothetical protein
MNRLIWNMVDYLKVEMVRREIIALVDARFSMCFVNCKRKNTTNAIDAYDGIS